MSDSRYRVLGQPTVAPGHCYVTGETGAEHGPYVDTGMSIRPQSTKGALYLGANAVKEMYRELCKFEGIDEELKHTDSDMEDRVLNAFDAGRAVGIQHLQEAFNVFASSYSADSSNAGTAPAPEPVVVSEDTGVSEGDGASADEPPTKSSSLAGSKGNRGVSGSDVLPTDTDSLGFDL